MATPRCSGHELWVTTEQSRADPLCRGRQAHRGFPSLSIGLWAHPPWTAGGSNRWQHLTAWRSLASGSVHGGPRLSQARAQLPRVSGRSKCTCLTSCLTLPSTHIVHRSPLELAANQLPWESRRIQRTSRQESVGHSWALPSLGHWAGVRHSGLTTYPPPASAPPPTR